MIKKEVIFQQAEKYDSFYFYDESKIIEYTNQLKSDFSTAEFLYSIKTNSNPAVVKCVFAQGFGADAASLAEVKLASKYGLSAEKIQYSAPGKNIADVNAALNISTIIADSLDEVYQIQELAKTKNITVEIGVRINPNFTFYSDTGTPSKFGIDESQVFQAISVWKSFSNVRIVGIHVHSRSQELNANVLENYYKKMFDLANAFQRALGYNLKFVNLGSGLGIPYSNEDEPLDTVTLGKSMAKLIADFKEKLSGTRIIIETGRYAVGKSGIYVTKVLDRKESMGKNICNS